MFRLTTTSMLNKSAVMLACIALLALGVYVVPQLKQELYPPITFPAISVITVYPGASPAQVEQDVTTPLEQSFQGGQSIQRISSSSSESVSSITVFYDFGTDLDKSQQALQQQANRIQSKLPANVTPQMQQFNLADIPIIFLSASSDQDQQDLALALKRVVIPAIQGIPGVANVGITGVRDRIVTITLDLKKLQAKGLSLAQVQSVLQANNLTLPAGETTSNDQTYAVRVGNTIHSIDDLAKLVVGEYAAPAAGQPSGSWQQKTAQVTYTPVKLGDVATILQDLSPSTSLTRTNGQPSLGIMITKASNGNAVSISNDLRAKIPDLEKQLGSGAKLTITSDQSPSIQSSMSDLAREGMVGAGFAILVILLFLFSIRSTLVTAISIPLSVVIALIGLWTQSYSLNVLTLTGLAIAIGRVVDDSIVVLENIYRHLRNGEEKMNAVLFGTREVATAVTASTLTTVAVFLPLSFIGGITGEYTHPMALTVTIALLASLLVALTVIPVLAYWFLKAPQGKALANTGKHDHPSIFERGYVPMIRWVVRHRIITIVLAVLLLIGSFALVPFLPVNAFGSQGGNSFTFNMKLAPNTSLDHTSTTARKIENVLSEVQGIETYQVTIGASASLLSGIGGSNIASFTVSTTSSAITAQVQQTVEDRLKQISDIGTVDFASQGTSTVDVTVQAADTQTLDRATQQVYNALAQTPRVAGITSDLSAAVPLIDVRVNPEKALAHGLTAFQVGQVLQMVYTGTTVTHVTFKDQRLNVDLRIDASATTVSALRDLLIPGPAGTVRLSDIAAVELVNGPTQISHLNGLRTATITLTPSGQDVGALTTSVQKTLDTLRLSDGATATLGTSASWQSTTLNQLYMALMIAIPLVFIVMVVTFRSLIQPLLLLVAIPFAFLGSIVLSVITQTPIGISSLFGFLMLIGIVVTNAIVLIDLVNHYRAKGLDARSAVIEGGRRRVRPILMTAVATICALLPLALGFGNSEDLVVSSGLAIVVMGGLATSTGLTLLLVPTLYTIVEDIRDRFRKKPAAPPEPARQPEPEPEPKPESKPEPVSAD